MEIRVTDIWDFLSDQANPETAQAIVEALKDPESDVSRIIRPIQEKIDAVRRAAGGVTNDGQPKHESADA